MASCDNCTKGYILPGEPVGLILDEYNGAYFSKGPEGYTKRAIVLLTDMFGLPLVNCKLIADHLAQSLSCDIWVPDLFDGRPIATAEEMEPIGVPDRAGVPFGIAKKLRMAAKMLPRASLIYSNRPAVAEARTISFITKLREAKNYDKVGAVGYCYGGMLCVRIGPGPLVDSVVICHPGSITIEEIKAIKVPAAWACAEDDISFIPKLRKQAELAFAARADFVEYEFKDYKGTAHGFACRPNLGLPEVKEGYEKALEQTIAWFEKTLPA